MIENLSRNDFADHLNTNFKVFFPDDAAREMRLVEASEISRRTRNESFSLLFIASGDVPAVQGLYRIEHTSLGAFDLFLVPVGRNEDGIEYEAVFNRLID